jgi:coatomer protein complex subunit epsilon
MDPFSAEGGTNPRVPFITTPTNHPELINIHNALHQGQYDSVLDFDTSALSPENQLPARILKLRARIALGATDEAIAEIDADSDGDNTPDLAAVKALAQHAAGAHDAALERALKLAESFPDNASVQMLGGTVLQGNGRSEEALGLLARHQGDLEAYVL